MTEEALVLARCYLRRREGKGKTGWELNLPSDWTDKGWAPDLGSWRMEYAWSDTEAELFMQKNPPCTPKPKRGYHARVSRSTSNATRIYFKHGTELRDFIRQYWAPDGVDCVPLVALLYPGQIIGFRAVNENPHASAPETDTTGEAEG